MDRQREGRGRSTFGIMAVVHTKVEHHRCGVEELFVSGFTRLLCNDDAGLPPERYRSPHPASVARLHAGSVNSDPAIDVSGRDDSSQSRMLRFALDVPRPAQLCDSSIPGEYCRSVSHNMDSARVVPSKNLIRRSYGHTRRG